MRLLLSIGLGVQLFALIIPANFVSELIISFTPYMVVANILIALIYFSLFSFKKHPIISWALTIIALIISGRFGYQYYMSYYTTAIVGEHPSIQTETDKTFTFFYGNIYYKNTEYSDILHVATQHNPDIIILIEYSKDHDQHLTSLFQLDYPYVSRHVGGKGYDGDVIFSKYPLTLLASHGEIGSFSHIAVEIQTGTTLDLGVLHTSAPISPYFYTIRNQQLSIITDTITNYYTNMSGSQYSILLGDFNTTPRSVNYNRINTQLKKFGLFDVSTELNNTKYQGILPYTRCHQNYHRLCSHIDHVRANYPTQLTQVTIPGSDHFGFNGYMQLPE